MLAPGFLSLIHYLMEILRRLHKIKILSSWIIHAGNIKKNKKIKKKHSNS